MNEMQTILQCLWERAKTRLSTAGVPPSEYVAYFDYIVEGLSRGFSVELREKYVRRGCDPEILEGLRDAAKPLEGELISIRLRKLREELSYLRRRSY